MRLLHRLRIGAVVVASTVTLLGAGSPATAATASSGTDEVHRIDGVGAGAAPLEGITWRLTEYVRRDQRRAVGDEIAAWVSLTAGKVRGSGGCNELSGRYSTMGNSLGVLLGRQGDSSCAEQTMVVERALFAGLGGAARYDLIPPAEGSSANLVVSDHAGANILRFEVDDVGALTDGEWLLVSYTSDSEWVPADPQQTAVLAFDPDRQNVARRSSRGDAVGSSGCNGVVARFFQHASALSFGALEVTDAPCSSSASRQQAAMLAVLEASSVHIELPPDRLLLTSRDSGERLAFRSSSPLEGSTWLLTRLSGKPAPDAAVTMRLQDGQLSGEGPCGSYAGSYLTDGMVLSFSDVSGSGSTECDELRSELRLLDALGHTVLVDKAAPGLRLLDTFGRTLARFRHPAAP